VDVSKPRGSGPVARIGDDPEAFEAFYREHLQSVLRYATRRTRDPHAAADLVADVFLAAIGAAPGYREERGTPIAWLHGIARNVAASQNRRAARIWAAEGRVAGHRMLDGDDITRLEERIDAERASRQLLERIALLPTGPREVLELVAVDGLTVTEAAKALGISQVAARVRLHRARKALQPPQADPDAPPLLSPLMEA
jgi:RNA polymerase sigma-70 factor (ECF subfamily)